MGALQHGYRDPESVCLRAQRIHRHGDSDEGDKASKTFGNDTTYKRECDRSITLRCGLRVFRGGGLIRGVVVVHEGGLGCRG